MPCHAARARELLAKGKAVVVRRYPFVIRLKHNPIAPETQPVAIKLDPGAKTTGIAICPYYSRRAPCPAFCPNLYIEAQP